MSHNNDFSTDHLDGEALRIAEVITEAVSEWTGRPADGGGCRAFYTPEQWVARGEDTDDEVLHGVVLVVCHDGGDLSIYAGSTGDFVDSDPLSFPDDQITWRACRLRERINRRLYSMGASCGHCGAVEAIPGYFLEEYSHWFSAVYAIGGGS